MLNNERSPHILLASPEQQTSSLIETSSERECKQVVQVLESLADAGAATLTDVRKGTRTYLRDYLNKGKKSAPVHILHLTGARPVRGTINFPAPEDNTSYSLEEFAKSVAKLRQLQLVILSGVATPELIRHLLIRGVPRILTIRPDFQDAGLVRELYLQLIQGKTFDEAYLEISRLVEGHEIGLNFLEVTYDSKTKTLDWEGPERVPAAFNNGLVVRPNSHKGRKNWRLIESPIPAYTREQTEPIDQVPDTPVQPIQQESPAPDLKEEFPALESPIVLPGGHRGPAERPTERKTPRRKPNRKRPDKTKRPQVDPLKIEIQQKKQRFKKVLLTSLVAVSLLGMVGLLFPGIPRSIQNLFENNPASAWDCAFPIEEGKYNVMVLPFQEQPNCQAERTDFKNTVVSALQEMKMLEGIPIRIKEQSQFQTCTMDQAQARDIAATCGAHLLVWGWYLTDTLTGRNVLDLHFYSTNTSGESLFLEGTGGVRRIFVDQLSFTPSPLAQHVETMIYWAMAMQKMQKADYLSAIDLFKRISDETQNVNAMVSLMLTRCYDQAGQYDQALAYYNQLTELNPEDPKVYIDRAGILTRMESFEKALEDYNTALRLDKDNISALIGRGILYNKQEGYQRALADFGRVLKMNPDWAPVYLSRAETFIQIRRYRDAMNDYNKAIALRPDYAQAYYGRAVLREQRDDLPKALADIDRALKANPSYTEAHLFRGDVYTKRSEWDNAIEAYTEVLKQQASAEAFFKRSQTFQRMGEFEKAMSDLNRAVDLKPSLESAWFARGQLHQAAEQYEKALGDFDQVLRLQPGNTPALSKKGEVWLAMGEIDSALQSFEYAMEMDQDNPEPFYQRSLLYLSQSNVDAALKDVNLALKKDNTSSEAFMTRGRIHLKMQSFNKALKDFNQALKLDPMSSESFAFRGQTYLAMENLTRAQLDFEQCITLGSLRPEVFLGLGDIYLEREKYEKALEKFDAAVQIAPEAPLAYLKRGDYFFRFKQYDESLENYDKALEFDAPNQTAIYVNRGIIHTELGHTNQALADFNIVLQRHPDSAEIYCLRGLLYQKMDNRNQALDDFTRALDLDPNIPNAYYSRGILYQDLEEFNRAINAYTEAIELDPSYADAYNKRGEVYFILEEFEKAILDYNQAIAIDSKHADAYNNRGNLTRKAGDFDRAVRDYSLAIQYDPYQADALYNRGFIRAMRKQYDDAIEDITQSLEIKPEQGIRYGFLAKIYAQRQDDERFFANIELALQFDYPKIELEMDPAYKYYKDNPRFKQLLEN